MFEKMPQPGDTDYNEKAERVNQGLDQGVELTSISDEVEQNSERERSKRAEKTKEAVSAINKVLQEFNITPEQALEKTQFVADKALLSVEETEKVLTALEAQERAKPKADVLEMKPKGKEETREDLPDKREAA